MRLGDEQPVDVGNDYLLAVIPRRPAREPCPPLPQVLDRSGGARRGRGRHVDAIARDQLNCLVLLAKTTTQNGGRHFATRLHPDFVPGDPDHEAFDSLRSHSPSGYPKKREMSYF